MAVTLSANIDDRMAHKVRDVAEREHRSVSNVISSALSVFTVLPKDVRDTFLELQSQHDADGIKRLSREMMTAVSRLRLEGDRRATDVMSDVETPACWPPLSPRRPRFWSRTTRKTSGRRIRARPTRVPFAVRPDRRTFMP